MDFEIPANLGDLTVTALTAKSAAAKAEYDALYTSVTPDTVTDEQINDLKTLHQFFSVTIPNEISGRNRRSTEFAALGTQPEGDEGDGEPEGEPEAVTASATVEPVVNVTLNDIIDQKGNSVATPERFPRPRYSTLVAAAGVPNKEAA